MEDNKGNVESLAAFLHSGGHEAAPVKTETAALPSENISSAVPYIPEEPDVPYIPDDDDDITEAAVIMSEPPKAAELKRSNTDSLSDVLFSLDSKKKERYASEKPAAMQERSRRTTPIIDDDEEEDFDEQAEQEESTYELPGDTPIHYDNAATQMMDIGQGRSGGFIREPEEETYEEREERREISRLKLKYEKQRLRSRTFAFILVGIFLSVVVIGVSAYISSYIVTFALDLTGIATNDFKIDVSIPDDANTELVAAILQENNIIKSAKFFKFFADFSNKKDTFQPGTYTLSSTMSYSTLFSTLQDRSIEYKTVTIRIVEGMTASEIAALLEENKVCYAEDFEAYYKNLQKKYDFERRITEKSTKFNQLEGYLFPDTYEFYAVLDIPDIEYDSEEEERKAKDAQRKKQIKNAEEAADKMYDNFEDKITKQMYKQMGEMELTLDDVITLASMVQREAASTEDMHYVASVFLNRLNNIEDYPNLQSDVTVLYVENDIKPFIDDKSARYTRLADAYNTYNCKGIPAGPICNPGLDAINAVLDPEETNYFYFCANSETGEVYYAATHEEHEANLILAGLA